MRVCVCLMVDVGVRDRDRGVSIATPPAGKCRHGDHDTVVGDHSTRQPARCASYKHRRQRTQRIGNGRDADDDDSHAAAANATVAAIVAIRRYRDEDVRSGWRCQAEKMNSIG